MGHADPHVPAQGGLFRLVSPFVWDDLEKLAARQSLELFNVDGMRVSGKRSFLRETAAALGFPDYFGHNWDAFEELLTDLRWCPARGYLLVFGPVDHFASRQRTQWATALDILRSAVDYWDTLGRPMLVLLHGDDQSLIDLPELAVAADR